MRFDLSTLEKVLVRGVSVLVMVTLLMGASCPPPAPTVVDEVPENLDLVQAGDQLQVIFRDVPQDLAAVPLELTVKEDGTFNLPLIGTVTAAGKQSSELQEEIRDLYVPKYYRRMTVNVTFLNRLFFVGGEVRQQNQYTYSAGLTVLKAISAAGGFTDYANKHRVQLTRGISGAKYVIDCLDAEANPELDLPVYPDDRIHVPRRRI